MNRPVQFKTRPQLALESYLDALLQDATAEEMPEAILVLEPAVEPDSPLDEFQQAVMEEQARDAQVVEAPVVVPSAPAVVAPPVVEPLVDVHLPPSITPPTRPNRDHSGLTLRTGLRSLPTGPSRSSTS